MKKSLKRLILQACYACKDAHCYSYFSEEDSFPGHWVMYQRVPIKGFYEDDTVDVDIAFSGEREVKSFLRVEFESLM